MQIQLSQEQQNGIYKQCRSSSVRSNLIRFYTVCHSTKYIKAQLHKIHNLGQTRNVFVKQDAPTMFVYTKYQSWKGAFSLTFPKLISHLLITQNTKFHGPSSNSFKIACFQDYIMSHGLSMHQSIKGHDSGTTNPTE